MLPIVQKVAIISKIALIIFLYYLTYYVFIGIKNPIPAPGDSFDYHIPISLSILNGDFLTLSHQTQTYSFLNFSKTFSKMPQWYYPGSSEAINSVFISLGIPLTLSNIFAVVILLVTLFKLGRTFRLGEYFSLLFSLSFVTLNGVVRWFNAVSIDFWVVIWFAWSLILFEKPQKTISYFLRLGFVLGMIIGSKITGIFLLASLFVFYFKKIIKLLNFKRVLAFSLPFSLGIVWYVRNWALVGNPFYPVAIFGFKGPFDKSPRILTEIIFHPIDILNAAFSEYHLWLFLVPFALFFLIQQIKQFKLNEVNQLFLIAVGNLVFFLTLPSSSQPWIMVSGIRYSLPAFLCLFLGTFIIFSKWGKEELLGYFVIGNMVTILSMVYYPKLLLIFLPISFFIFYLLEKRVRV